MTQQNLYELTGDIKDINTLLISREEWATAAGLPVLIMHHDDPQITALPEGTHVILQRSIPEGTNMNDKEQIAKNKRELLAQMARHPVQELARLEPFVHGLGKAILRELIADDCANTPYDEGPFTIVVEPVATMWREKNTKLYPGVAFDLTEVGKTLPLGVRYELYTTPPQTQDEIAALHVEIDGCHKRMIKQQAEMEALRQANLDCVDHFKNIKEDYDKAQDAMKQALVAITESSSLICAMMHEKRPYQELEAQVVVNRGTIVALEGEIDR